MKVTGAGNEYIELRNSIKPSKEKYPLIPMFTIIWNTKGCSTLQIDGLPYLLEKHNFLFISDFREITFPQHEGLRMLRFNHEFYCVVSHDSEVGCRGLLFYANGKVPMVSITEHDLPLYETLWDVFNKEMITFNDAFQIEMLQMLLKRFLILATRSFIQNTAYVKLEKNDVDIIREYNFLVEKNFKSQKTVEAYASLLHKSPKTLANLFKKLGGKTPLEYIQNRVVMEAKSLLIYSKHSISEIGYTLGYEDIQSFSRFFKKQTGLSPSTYRENKQKEK